MIMLISSYSFSATAFSATAKGAVSSLSNTSSGIKVSWTKDTAKTGYYIYRKVGSDKSYKKVKTITKNSTTSWTDTNVSNGKKYVYRVRAYKGSKVASTTANLTIYRLSKAKISSLSRASSTSITVKSSKNSSANGFQVVYSTKSDFSSCKKVKVSGTTLNKTITGLTKGKKYYVKIRAYKTVSGKTYYGAYSDVKNVVTYYTAYTTKNVTTIYDKADTKTGKKTTLSYMTKVSIYNVTKSYSSGKYQKLKYNGSYYYAWIPTGETKFTTTKNKYDYSGMTDNRYAQEVIDYAVWIFKNWDTEYVNGQSNGVINSNGKYGFDCSGFVSYVINTCMKKYVPVYKLTSNIEVLHDRKAIYNQGFSTQFDSTVVCEGKINYNKLKPGDVLFFNLRGGKKNSFAWNHCALYLGDKMFINSASFANGVTIQPLEGTYVEDFVCAIRYIPEKIKPINEDMTTNKKINVYVEPDSSTEAIQIPAGETVRLVYYNATYTSTEKEHWGYIMYNGKHYFLYNPLDKIS